MLIVQAARLVGIALVVAACAASSGGSTVVNRDRTMLTAENLAPYGNQPLWQVISKERPSWLATRGTAGLSVQDAGDIVVYVNGTKMGGREYLRDVTADVVTSVRFLSGAEAQTRYGMNHQYGAIVITTLKR
jgi:hypothetical protein